MGSLPLEPPSVFGPTGSGTPATASVPHRSLVSLGPAGRRRLAAVRVHAFVLAGSRRADLEPLLRGDLGGALAGDVLARGGAHAVAQLAIADQLLQDRRHLARAVGMKAVDAVCDLRVD